MKQLLIVSGIVIIAFFFGNFLTNKPLGNSHPQVQGVSQETSSVSPQQFHDLLNSGGYVLLDVRTADEYAAGHLKNAKQIDYYQTQAFTEYIDTLNKKAKYLIYCRTGKRSSLALKMMQDLGFVSVSDMTGGYNAWSADGLPTE